MILLISLSKWPMHPRKIFAKLFELNAKRVEMQRKIIAEIFGRFHCMDRVFFRRSLGLAKMLSNSIKTCQ